MSILHILLSNQDSEISHWMQAEWGLQPSDRAWFAGVTFWGFTIGTVMGALVGDAYGRRPLIIAHSSLYIPSAIISGLSQGFAQLLIMRFLIGISLGREICCSCKPFFTPRGCLIVGHPSINPQSGLFVHSEPA